MGWTGVSLYAWEWSSEHFGGPGVQQGQCNESPGPAGKEGWWGDGDGECGGAEPLLPERAREYSLCPPQQPCLMICAATLAESCSGYITPGGPNNHWQCQMIIGSPPPRKKESKS